MNLPTRTHNKSPPAIRKIQEPPRPSISQRSSSHPPWAGQKAGRTHTGNHSLLNVWLSNLEETHNTTTATTTDDDTTTAPHIRRNCASCSPAAGAIIKSALQSIGSYTPGAGCLPRPFPPRYLPGACLGTDTEVPTLRRQGQKFLIGARRARPSLREPSQGSIPFQVAGPSSTAHAHARLHQAAVPKYTWCHSSTTKTHSGHGRTQNSSSQRGRLQASGERNTTHTRARTPRRRESEKGLILSAKDGRELPVYKKQGKWAISI